MAGGGRQTAAEIAGRLLRPLAPERNAAGTVYGLTMIGAVLAAESYRRNSCADVLASGALALALYWVAHAYATAAGHRMSDGERFDVHMLGRSLREDWPIVRGGTVPLLAVALAWAAGASTELAAGVAVWSTVGALIVLELLVGVRAQAGPKGVLLEGCLGVGLGAAVLGLRVLLH